MQQNFKFILVFLLGLSLCSCNKKNEAVSALTTDVIRIGEVSTMTGPEATFGMGTHRGIDLAVRQINENGGIQGKKIQLYTLDDQGRPEETAAAAMKLIAQNHVVALTGGLPSSRAMAMAPIAQSHSIPMVSPSGTNPKVTQFGNFIFRVCFIDPFQGRVMAQFALKNLKLQKVAILQDMKSDYSMGLSDFFRSTFKDGGGEISINQTYSSGDVDFKSQLTSILAKKPQALFVPGYYTEVALIARQARELGLNVPLLGGDGWDSPKFLEIGGQALNNSFYSTHYSNENTSSTIQNFVQRYKLSFSSIPDGLATLGYDAMMVLAEAMKQSPNLKPDEIRQALTQIRDFQMVTGKISFDENRNPVKSATILKIEKGHLNYMTTIDP